jgi:hypothetical protein
MKVYNKNSDKYDYQLVKSEFKREWEDLCMFVRHVEKLPIWEAEDKKVFDDITVEEVKRLLKTGFDGLTKEIDIKFFMPVRKYLTCGCLKDKKLINELEDYKKYKAHNPSFAYFGFSGKNICRCHNLLHFRKVGYIRD